MRWAGHESRMEGNTGVFWKNLNGGDRYEYSGHKHENNIDINHNCQLVGSGTNLSGSEYGQLAVHCEINPTRCNNCFYSSQWLYSTCFG